ncbi:MAG: glycine zipper domain-containing protein [Rubripirellula sp.]
MYRFTVLLIAISLVTSDAVEAQYNTQRGATVGGLTGAIAGGLIGDHNGNAGAGAVIGGMVGAVTGGLLGEAKDQQEWVRRQQAIIQQSNNQGSLLSPSHLPASNTVTTMDVIEMHLAGLSDELIINQISQRGISNPLTVKEIIELHQRGISENVITALQQAKQNRPVNTQPRSVPTPTTYYAPVPSTTTIWMSQPLYRNYCPPRYQPHHYHHHHHHPLQNFGIHLRF